MTAHFIEAEIDLQESPGKLHQAIEAELQTRGAHPRWAVTAVAPPQRTAHVEAIVMQDAVGSKNDAGQTETLGQSPVASSPIDS